MRKYIDEHILIRENLFLVRIRQLLFKHVQKKKFIKRVLLTKHHGADPCICVAFSAMIVHLLLTGDEC